MPLTREAGHQITSQSCRIYKAGGMTSIENPLRHGRCEEGEEVAGGLKSEENGPWVPEDESMSRKHRGGHF